MQRSIVWYSKVGLTVIIDTLILEWVFVIKYKATIIFHTIKETQ